MISLNGGKNLAINLRNGSAPKLSQYDGRIT